jgi:RNA polymerase sigma-70 factor, ECF subfamily
MQLALDASLPNVSAAERTGSELDDIDALVRTYRPRLLRFVAFSIGDADLAESITQDCFLKAYNGRANFRGDCSVNTWLTSIAVNLIRDQQRLQKFRFWRQARATAIDVTDAANFLPSHESSPESRVLVQEKADQVQAALVNLSPNQRSIFLMRFADEMDLSEIAALTKMPINTVKTHLHRALKSVRSQVGNSQAGNSQAGTAQPGSAPSAPTPNLQTSAKSQVAAQKISGGKP